MKKLKNPKILNRFIFLDLQKLMMSDFKKTGKFIAVCGNIGAGKSTYIK